MAKGKVLEDNKSDIRGQNKSLNQEKRFAKITDQDNNKSSRVWWTVYYLLPIIVVVIGSLLSYLSMYSIQDKTRRLNVNSKQAKKTVLLSSEDVAKYDGSDPNLPMYLVILGKVYDVSKGKKFYAPGTGYNIFVGRDSTPSFITGKFSREQATDDASGLSAEEMLGVKGWMDFYRKEYTFVGKMIGRYYDTEGNPTEALKAAREKIKEGKRLKKVQEDFNQKFPGCNSQWSREEGSTLWCSKDSAGVHRDWVGVPRQYFKPGVREPACVCVRTSGPAGDTGKGDIGDLDNPHLREYEGCGKFDISCKLRS